MFNSASFVKTNAIEQLTAEVIGYDNDIAIIGETHLKKGMRTAALALADTRCSDVTEYGARVAV